MKTELIKFLRWVQAHYIEDGDSFISIDTAHSYTVEELVNRYIDSHKLN